MTQYLRYSVILPVLSAGTPLLLTNHDELPHHQMASHTATSEHSCLSWADGGRCRRTLGGASQPSWRDGFHRSWNRQCLSVMSCILKLNLKTHQMSAEQVTKELQIAQDVVEDSKNAVGVGFLVWRFRTYDKAREAKLASPASASRDHPETTKRIDAALQGGAKAIWLAFGEAQELVFWSKVVRARSDALKLPRAGLALFISAGSETEAKAVLQQTDADVLVAQGMSSRVVRVSTLI